MANFVRCALYQTCTEISKRMAVPLNHSKPIPPRPHCHPGRANYLHIFIRAEEFNTRTLYCNTVILMIKIPLKSILNEDKN